MTVSADLNVSCYSELAPRYRVCYNRLRSAVLAKRSVFAVRNARPLQAVIAFALAADIAGHYDIAVDELAHLALAFLKRRNTNRD